MVVIIISQGAAERDVNYIATYIIIRRNANGNENGPRKKKFVMSLQTCNRY